MMCKVLNKKHGHSNGIYIGRPTKWGNPFTHLMKVAARPGMTLVADRQAAVDEYRQWLLTGDGQHLLKDLHELTGQNLICWCAPDACHGDVLLELANAES